MPIIQTSIFDLRNIIIPNTLDTYFVTDEDKQGNWYFDPTDLVSLDNEGTILVGFSGSRYKRIYDGYVNVKWFGAKGNNYLGVPFPNDDTIAIQKALDFISTSNYLELWNSAPVPPYQYREFGMGTLFFPIGNYLITDTLLVGPFVKIMGQTKSGNTSPYNSKNNNGSIISCNFSRPTGENGITYNKWMIESSSFYTSNSSFPGQLQQIAQILSLSVDYDGQKIIWTNGFSIENISLNTGFLIENPSGTAFGGIKLSGSYYPLIRNVSIINTRIGIMLNACVYAEIDNIFNYSFWFGLVITNCNVVKVDSFYHCGSKPFEQSLYSPELTNIEIQNEEKYGRFPWHIQKFFMNEIPFSSTYHIQDPKIYKGKCGIIAYFGVSLSLNSVSCENTSNGVVLLDSVCSASSFYSEQLANFGVVTAGTRFNFVDFILNVVPKPFYLGHFSFGDISNVNVGGYLILFEDLQEPKRLINFSKVLDYNNTARVPKCIYSKQVIFLDETPIGPNIGIVYVDPKDGNDSNYGFSISDPLKSFDAALIRVQNQSTLNPVHTILLKANIPIEIPPFEFPIIKDLSIKEIENCNLLITGYSDNLIKPILYFPSNGGIHEIGQILLKGNCSITFKNVDITLFDPQGDDYGSQLVVFGLENTFARFVFSNVNFNYGIWYYIFESTKGNSNLEVKINDSTFGGTQFFTPFVVSGPNIIVDCVQIGSFSNPTPWANSIVIRNNL
ncbi:MAG: hypothetical protein CFE21_14645 [Bacteroidetes bacterium B1(2017)]|nr:MAG: hypothetical protein CFE21_14645 [Bacteroidetes bacterium B1(2017)]